MMAEYGVVLTAITLAAGSFWFYRRRYRDAAPDEDDLDLL